MRDRVISNRGGSNVPIFYRFIPDMDLESMQGRENRTVNEYDELFLRDPSLRDAVLYELEMLHPPPREPISREPIYNTRPRARPELPETSPLIVESTLVPVPSSQHTPLSPSQRKSSNQFIWFALLALVLVGAALFLGPKVQQAPTPTATQTLRRIPQLDESQYTNKSEYDTWAASTCSTAAMAEVINAYEALKHSHSTYRVTDILKVESEEQQITPDEGLLYGLTSIQRTVAPFHFKATALQPATLDNVIQTAQAGQPIIVAFRDPYWFPTGHILLVRGGDAQKVSLADSSKLDLKALSRSQFMKFWTGFAVLVEPQ